MKFNNKHFLTTFIMKKNIYLKGAAATVLSLALASCASDYLDTPTHGNIDSDEVCATTETAHQAVIGACQGLAGVWSYDLLYQFLGIGDVAVGTFYGEMPGSDSFNNFFLDVNPSWDIYYRMDDTMGKGNYVWDEKTWMWAYAMIGQVNEVLDGIDGAAGSDEERAFTKAEALTLRAHCYWRLLQAYAPRWEASNNGQSLSVILRVSAKQEQDLPLSPMIDVLDQMYADLDEAIVNYKAAGSYRRTLTYEPDLSVCYGVYARTAALKNDWEKVKTMAHNARQGFHSATKEEAFSGYCAYVNNEWMWSGSFAAVDDHVYSNWSTNWACNGFRACNASGTNRINIDLYNKIPETDARRDLWMTVDKLDVDRSLIYNAKNINPLNMDIRQRTVRRAATAWIEDHQNKNDGFTDLAYTSKGQTEGSDQDVTAPVICDGAQMKFWSKGLLGQNGWGFPPFMRATEMYLLEAEACAMLGQSGEAQAILNEVNRKFNPDYTCTATGQQLIDEVRDYTRIELWGEGFCWFNLKRWGLNLTRRAWMAGDPASGNLPAAIECNVGPNDANLWRYGIPRSETNYNVNVTYPYPGNGM